MSRQVSQSPLFERKKKRLTKKELTVLAFLRNRDKSGFYEIVLVA